MGKKAVYDVAEVSIKTSVDGREISKVAEFAPLYPGQQKRLLDGEERVGTKVLPQ